MVILKFSSIISRMYCIKFDNFKCQFVYVFKCYLILSDFRRLGIQHRSCGLLLLHFYGLPFLSVTAPIPIIENSTLDILQYIFFFHSERRQKAICNDRRMMAIFPFLDEVLFQKINQQHMKAFTLLALYTVTHLKISNSP